jgi:YVTN family beta-propeller protein
VAALVVLVLLGAGAVRAAGALHLLGGRAGNTRTGSPGTRGVPPPTVQQEHRLELATHTFSIETHPDGASARLRWPGGATQDVKTPFHGQVRGGLVTVSIRMAGRNPLTQQVMLDRNRSLSLWLDPAGLLHHELRSFPTCPAPKQVAFTPDQKQLWVTCLGGDGVWVYDTATWKRVSDIKLGVHGAVEVIFNRQGTLAYASQMETASVFEIDARTFQVRRQLFTRQSWSKVLALSPDEKTLYVSNWVSDNVTEIDLTTGDVRRNIPTVDTPRGLYVTPDGKRLFVAGFGHGDLQRIDLATLQSKILIHTGGAMRHLVGDPSRGLLYADDMATDAEYVVNLATEQVRKLSPTDHTPNTIDLSPDGKVLYVSDRGRNNPRSYYLPGPEWGSVLAIDTATGKPLDAIVGGNQTTGLDVSPDGRLLAYSDFLDNRISVFSIPSYQVLAGGQGGRYRAHFADLEK